MHKLIPLILLTFLTVSVNAQLLPNDTLSIIPTTAVGATVNHKATMDLGKVIAADPNVTNHTTQINAANIKITAHDAAISITSKQVSKDSASIAALQINVVKNTSDIVALQQSGGGGTGTLPTVTAVCPYTVPQSADKKIIKVTVGGNLFLQPMADGTSVRIINASTSVINIKLDTALKPLPGWVNRVIINGKELDVVYFSNNSIYIR